MRHTVPHKRHWQALSKLQTSPELRSRSGVQKIPLVAEHPTQR